MDKGTGNQVKYTTHPGGGLWVEAEIYDALAARLAEAERLLTDIETDKWMSVAWLNARDALITPDSAPETLEKCGKCGEPIDHHVKLCRQ